MQSFETEKLLAERLKQIDIQIDMLKDEKTKVKQALGLFKGLDLTLPQLSFSHEPTFKEKVKTAMLDAFQDGATSGQILEYLNKNWTRPVKRESLSPQLSRLKEDEVLILEGNLWKLKSENPALAGPSEF